MGVAGAVAGTFGIQPLVGAFGVPYQAAEPRDERQIRVPLRNSGQMSQGGFSSGRTCGSKVAAARRDLGPRLASLCDRPVCTVSVSATCISSRIVNMGFTAGLAKTTGPTLRFRGLVCCGKKHL